MLLWQKDGNCNYNVILKKMTSNHNYSSCGLMQASYCVQEASIVAYSCMSLGLEIEPTI